MQEDMQYGALGFKRSKSVRNPKVEDNSEVLSELSLK